MAMNINKNFVGSRMNKTLDERLIPNGEYKDALNIRISSSENGEAGSVENSKGNEKVVTLKYEGSTLTNALCIGAYEDGANETIYWFVTSDDADMIVSYNTRTEVLIYHVVSETVLNFSSKHLINGVNLIDEYLFFTDNYNPPRRINVKRNYPKPSSNVDQITEDDIAVIVKPPVSAPTLTLITRGSKENYIEDKFIRFAYRYKYKDGEYSALSEFSEIAFSPGQFKLDYGNYDMIGMQNTANSVSVSFNTGSSDVVGVDLCFKLSTSNIINVVEKFDKVEKGWSNNDDVSIEFNNQKIYTTLPESELLRVYDNVPKKAKSQTVMGNRIIYGNYVDGYDIDTVVDYEVELVSQEVGFNSVSESESDGVAYTIDSSTTITDAKLDMDLSDIELKEGGSLYIDFDIVHNSFGGSATYTSAPENSYQETFQFTFPRDFSSVGDLATSSEFIDSIQSSLTFANAANGYSLTDLFYAQIQAKSGWTADGGGITSATGDFAITYSGNTLSLQVPAIRYEDDANAGTYAFEYFNMGTTTVSVVELGNRQSLHSNRDYELGIVYLDEYNRASTALVCSNNTVYVPPQNSATKNSIKATIKNLAPTWAKRYRLVLKPSKGSYETIYSNLYFWDPEESAWWVKLEGDHQTKAKVGDNLIVKRSSTGPTSTVVKTKILDLENKEKHFIDDTQDAEVPKVGGVFMKIKPVGFSISEPEDSNIDYGTITGRNKDVLYGTSTESSGTYTEYDIPAGSQITFNIKNERLGSGSSCGSRYYIFDRTYTATKDYDNMYDFIVGENIKFDNPTNNPDIDSSDDTTPTGTFISSVGSYNDLQPQSSTSYKGFNGNILDPSFSNGVLQVKYYRHPSDGRAWLGFKNGGRKCNGRNSWLNVSIEVVRANNLLVFETEAKNNTNEIYYESTDSYSITNRYHSANNTNQDASNDAVVDVDLFDCFCFGNGVESLKIDDGLAKPSFKMGARVTSVSEQDYKEAHRYADLTYSGVYNEETNVNKLNEFNLGLVNFKTLEKSFGPINKLHARQTDILVLQEDKISYVLAGKNLLSDAGAGGAIVSTPEVLGTQISRLEEFGISNNPGSFSIYGTDIFFTDSKRGSVINIQGGSAKTDKLNIISQAGMRSWFRDQFISKKNNILLGGYDPYMNEYVLSMTDRDLEIETDTIECGMPITQESSSKVVTYNVTFDDVIGTSTINYSVTSGSVNISVTYDGTEDINSTVTGTGTLTFSKDNYSVNNATLIITPTNATYEVTVGCVATQSLTVVRIVKNTDRVDTQTIHHEYSWAETGHTSPITTDAFTFDEGPVSLYKSVTGSESQGVIPAEGSTVTMKYVKKTGDTADFGTSKFKYLVSDTLYTEAQIGTLAPLLQEATPISTPSTGVKQASFTYTNSSDHQYLYLVWDYGIGVADSLCYSNTNAEDVCCDCSGGTTSTYYVDGTELSDAIGIYTDSNLLTKAADGYYSDLSISRQQSSGDLLSSQTCTCSVSCGSNVSASGNVGNYTVDIDTGTDTGAVVIYFQPYNIPDGILATYDSSTYNTLTTNDYGVELATAGELNFVGSSGTSGCDTSDLQGSTTSVSDFTYDGSSFVDQGTTTSIVIPSSGTVNLNATGNIYYTLVVPKPNASPSSIELRIVGVCSGTAFKFKAICPTSLPSFSSSSVETTSNDACSATQDQTYYFVRNSSTTGTSDPVADTNTLPQVGNFVFSDVNGATALSDGFYKITSNTVAQVANGVVSAITSCGASLTSYTSSQVGVFNATCPIDGSVNTLDQTYYHDGSGTYPTAGDTCYSDSGGTTPLDAGYYVLGNSTSGTGNRNYIFIDNNVGEVEFGYPQTC